MPPPSKPSTGSWPGDTVTTYRPPRVLQIGKFYPPYRGGMETHMEMVCGQLRDRYDIRVAVANSGRTTIHETCDGVQVTRLATPFSITSAPVNPGLPAAIRAAAPDLVHLHLPHPGAVLGVLASRYRGPLVVTYHSDVVRQRLMSGVFMPLLHRLLDRAATIIVSSQRYAESSPVLARHQDRCRTVPFGIAPSQPDAVEVERIRARFGPRLVLGVGRFVYYKGFDVLIDAMPGLDANLVLIGDGPLRGDLTTRLQRAGLGDRVTLVGTVPDTASYFAAANVFALPSVARSEAFGIVQLEAMAAGTPVVNTALDSGVPWVSRDGESGLTVPPGDARALGAALARLLDDPSLRQRFGAAAQERVRTEFSVPLMISRLTSIYDAALARAEAPALT